MAVKAPSERGDGDAGPTGQTLPGQHVGLDRLDCCDEHFWSEADVLKLHRDFNHIGVRTFILYGAPPSFFTIEMIVFLS